MKKTLWIAAGIAGMLIGDPAHDAKADVNVHIGIGGRPSLSIDIWPSFIYVPELGFSVSVGSDWDILSYDNYYYVYRDGYWFRSSHRRGPWIIVHYDHLPYKIRRHNWAQIRHYRDFAYRRHHDSYWFDRNQYLDLMYIPALGFSVSIGSPWDILYYDHYYYAYRDGFWYRSSNYRGPWKIHNHNRLPSKIRRHNWGDIRKYRDFEYRRHYDKRFDDRRFDEKKRFDGVRKFDDDRKFDGVRKFDDDRKFDGVRKFDDDRKFDGVRKFDDDRKFNGIRKFDDDRKLGSAGKYIKDNDERKGDDKGDSGTKEGRYNDVRGEFGGWGNRDRR